MSEQRGWLSSETNILVDQYKRRDMTGVYNTIERMMLLDQSHTVTITVEEARIASDWYERCRADAKAPLNGAESDFAALLNERGA